MFLLHVNNFDIDQVQFWLNPTSNVCTLARISTRIDPENLVSRVTMIFMKKDSESTQLLPIYQVKNLKF